MNYFAKVFIFYFYFINFSYALDFGTGADGRCILSGIITNKTYNCTSLSIPTGSHAFMPGTVVTIKVKGDASIIGNLSLNGGNGANGTNGGGSLAGTAGPGGYAGGGCSAAIGCTLEHGSSADGTSNGLGGRLAVDNAFDATGGGGGSGGNHNSSFSAAAGADGTKMNIGSLSVAGVGGAIPSTTFGNELLFETTMIGGSGGGAGGTGIGLAFPSSGGAGGGGGGAIKIIADGDIFVTGSIRANGGNGGNGEGDATFGPSGGGGGGSGGAIWLYATGDIFLNTSTSLQVNGGSGGARSVGSLDASGGAGGDGAPGRVRLDDFDGIIANANSFAVIGSNGQFLYESSIAAGCGLLEDVNKKRPSRLGIVFLFVTAIFFTAFIFLFNLLLNRKKPYSTLISIHKNV